LYQDRQALTVRCRKPRSRSSIHEAQNIYRKSLERHEVVPETPETPAVLYVDLHLVHEVTSPQAFRAIARRQPRPASQRSNGRDDRSLESTDPDEVFGRIPIKVESAARQVRELEKELP